MEWYDPILLSLAVVIAVWLYYRRTDNPLQTTERRKLKDRRKKQRRWTGLPAGS